MRLAASLKFTSKGVRPILFRVPEQPRNGVFSKKERRSWQVSIGRNAPAVESVPGKVSGAWVLRGTRMPVSAIFEDIEAGANIDDIVEWFDGLDREQVKAVIEFAARSLDKAPALTP
jgi:uncharacterized protein (DUF433 family)